MDNNNQNIIGLDLPMKDSKGLAGLFLRYYSTFAALVCDTNSSTDYRINMFCDTMIASIPENETRQNIKDFKKALIKEKIESLGGNPEVDDKNRVIVEACMETIGEISNYVDQYLGTSKKIGVAIETAYPDRESDVDE